MVQTTQYVEYGVVGDQPMWNGEPVQIRVAPEMQHTTHMVHQIQQPSQPMAVKQVAGQAPSARRKQATQREKRRMEKLNHCIEDIRTIVCPNMKSLTKAKILREAINRIQYLERMAAELMAKKDEKVPNFEGAMPVPTTASMVPANQQVMIPQTYSPEANQSYIHEVAHAYSPGEQAAYSPGNGQAYSPEPPVHLPTVEFSQMSDESNSRGFEEQFYLQVQPAEPDQTGIQFYDEASFDCHAYYPDATMPYKFE